MDTETNTDTITETVKETAAEPRPAAKAEEDELAWHAHEEVEFIRVKSGQLAVFVEGEKFSLAEGEAVLVPPNLRHWMEPNGEGTCSVCFHPSLFDGKGYRRFIQPLMLNGKACTLKLSAGDAPWQEEALRILDELSRDEPDAELWELEFYGWVFILWNKIYQNYYAETPAFQTYRRLYLRLQSAINYIHDHYLEEFTIGSLADMSNLSVGTFCRYFKQLLGVTCIHYRNKFRIRKSRELLSNTDSKISDIAYMCGYRQLSLFNREFNRMMGCNPSEYRKHEVL